MTTVIDITKLPFPDIVETLEFATLRDEMIADFVARDPAYTAIVPSDPAFKMFETFAYFRLLDRQRVNDGARAVMPGYASGADADNIVVRANIERLVVDPGDATATPPIEPTYETDEAMFARYLLAWEALSVAGPEGAYEFHALSADGTVKDVYVKRHTAVGVATAGSVNTLTDTNKAWAANEWIWAKLEITGDPGAGQKAVVMQNNATGITSIQPAFNVAPGEGSTYTLDLGGEVIVSVLSTVGDGTPDAPLLAAVDAALNSKAVRPLTDKVTVQAASIVNYAIDATLTYYEGPSGAEILAAALVAVQAYVDAQHKIGRDINRFGIAAALFVSGVQNVTLTSPAADIVISDEEAGYCTGITINDGGVAE